MKIFALLLVALVAAWLLLTRRAAAGPRLGGSSVGAQNRFNGSGVPQDKLAPWLAAAPGVLSLFNQLSRPAGVAPGPQGDTEGAYDDFEDYEYETAQDYDLNGYEYED